MSDQASQIGGYLERMSPHVILRYRPDSLSSDQLEQLAARAEQLARHVHRRLKSLDRPRNGYGPLTVIIQVDAEAARDAPGVDQNTVQIAYSPGAAGLYDFAQSIALAFLRRRFGDADFWQPPPDHQADARAIANAMQFLALGLARFFATEAEREEISHLFANTAQGAAPRQSADQVVRQSAADRDGKVPLYECFLRGSALVASRPEYAALAESFCGYLFQREGPKSYFRFVRGSRDNPNASADLVYGKTFEQLQDEWLKAVVLGQTRRPISLARFGRQILPYLRPYTWLVFFGVMLIFLSAGVAQVAPFVVRDIIDLVTEAIKQGIAPGFFDDLWSVLAGTFTNQGMDASEFARQHALALSTLSQLYAKITVLAVAAFVQIVAITWFVYVVNVVGQNILRDLRLRFTDRMHHLSATFYARHRMGDMLARFTSDIARMADPLTQAVAYSIYYLVLVIATAISMVAMSWQLSTILLLILPAYFLVNRRFGPTMQIAARARQERLAQLNANLEEMLFGQTLIKFYGLGNHMMGRFRPKIGEFRKVAIWADFLNAVYKDVITIAENIQVKLVLAVGGTLALFGIISTGTIVGFYNLSGRFITPLHNIGLIYAGVAIASASLRRVEEILREPTESADVPPGGSYAPEGLGQGITFENVSFSYTGAEPTLSNINLAIPAGSKIAFVGPTGAGKSTLANLIPRFYDVDEGAVKIDGRDIRSFALPGLRQSISVVSQDTFIFNSTIIENIRLGRLEASDEEVMEAARGARLHDFIVTLPAGYDTLVGERGSRLSGGQKQRVAIARALLRGSPILILDEATSSLDAETESEILAELDEVTHGKTVISITHRLGLAIKSDTICVLQAGRIVQQGSHEALMQQDGLYRKLFEDQNLELMRRTVGQTEPEAEPRQPVPTFRLVSSGEVAGLASLGASAHYAAGEIIYPRNGSEPGRYLLRSGQVELLVPDEAGHEQRIFIGAPDGPNGQMPMSVLLDLPGCVRATATSESEILVLQDGQPAAGKGSLSA